MTSYSAYRIHQDPDGSHRAGIETLEVQPLAEGEVLIRTRYSSINYKDALAGTGKGKILHQFPLVGGIDSAGVVVESRSERYREGDEVIVTGYGLSVTQDGGYAEYLKVPGAWIVPLPEGLSLEESMIIGTAGFTAAYALHRLEQNGQRPELGPIVVTGASGGVGCVAVNLFSACGYEVVAVSGKEATYPWLRELGAKEVLGRDRLSIGERPLEKGLWGGAIDNVGGRTLAGLTRHLRQGGSIASIGLAGGIELNTTVMPFILRGISLIGIDSSACRYDLRYRLWVRLATDLKPALDRLVTQRLGLDGLLEAFNAMLAGQTSGRILVRTETAGTSQ